MNFDNVPEPSEKIMTPPGTIGVFDIENVEFSETPNGKRYMKISFSNHESSFSHNFFLTEAAISRVQTLAKAANGELLRGEVNDPGLVAAFKGKKVAVKVSGRVSDQNGRAYPDLSFGGFAKVPGEVEALAFNTKEREAIADCEAASASSSVSQADSESSTGGPTPTGTEEEF